VLRRLMSALRPPVLDNRGFAEALREHAQRFEEDTVARLRAASAGVGCDATNPAQLLREGLFGLAGMRERASLAGGTMEVGSLPGHGTTVEVRLPIAAATARVVVDRVDGRQVRIGGRWLADFASCNYLGLDLDPEILARVPEFPASWGTHPGWSRALASPALYRRVETEVAELLGAEDVLAFPP
jgi:hypothetical protein